MTEAEIHQRRAALSKSGGVCEVCGASLSYGMQGAHRIANTKPARAKYGSMVIDHPLNVGIVCRNMACNDALNIGNNPGKVLALLADIVAYEIRHFAG